MDNRIDNFLKIAEEKLLNDINNSYLRNELSTLADELIVITEDEEVRAKLKAAFKEIELKRRKAAWDERFLKIVAGEVEDDTSKETMYDNILRQASQGQLSKGAGRHSYGAGSLLSTGQTYPTTTGTTSLTMGNTTLTENELQKVKSMLSDREAQCTTP